MKLHLPKMLLTAVLAAAMAPAAWALSITGAGSLEDYTIDATKAYYGCNVTYTVDGSSKLGTISGLDTSMYTVTFDIDLEALTKTDEYNPMTSYNNVPLMYVNNGSYQWGFHVYDCTHKDGSPNPVADNQPDITGYWSNNNNKMYKQDEIFSQISNLTSGTVTAVIAQSKNDGGTRLFDGTDTTVATPYYSNPDLFTGTGGTIKSAVFNTNLVNTITVKEYTQFTASNTSGTWSKTFEGGKVTNATTGQVTLTGGDSGTAKDQSSPIVVGGAGQLKLEAWGTGNIVLDDDLYIGSSTYDEGAYYNAANYGVIRISNDDDRENHHYSTELSGNIYLVEDSSIKGTGSEPIVLSGKITDKGVPTTDGTVDGDYTLTLGGAGIDVSGTMDLGGLKVVQGYDSDMNNFAGDVTISSDDAQVARLEVGTNAKLTIAEGGSLAVSESLKFSQAIANSGSLDLSGATIVIDDSTTTGSYGYTKATGDVDGNGFLNGSFTVFTNSGDSASATTSIGGVTLYGVAQGAGTYSLSANGTLTVSDTTIYWVNNDTTNTKISSSVGSENHIVRVTAGKTYDVNGEDAYNKVVLENGATLANLSTTAVGTSQNGCNMKQNYYIELLGDANIEATSHFAMVKGGHEKATLKLNGHTLTKKGNDLFTINSAVADAGTIAITAGGIVLNEESDTYKSDLDEVAFTMASGTTLRNIDSMTIKSLSSNGGSITVDSGKKLTVAGTLTLGAGTTTQLTSGTLKANNMSVGNGGKLNMSTGTVLDLTGITLEDTNNGALDNCIAYASSATTNGTSYVLLAGTGNNNANMSSNVTLTSNVVTSGNLAINGRGWVNSGAVAGYDFTISDGATLKVGTSGTSKLGLITKADFIIADAAVIAGVVELGYSGGGANYDAFGTVTLNHKDSSLTAQKIQFQGGTDTTKNTGNALSMSNGTLEFTAEGAVLSGDYGTVSLTGGEVVVKKDQSMSTNTNLSVAVSNTAFNIAAGKTMELGEGVTTSGEITTKGSGTLRFKGAAGLTKATLDAGSKAVFEKELTASELSLGESAMLIATTVSEQLTLTAGAGSAVIETSTMPTTTTAVTVTDSATLQAGGSATGLGASLTMSDGSTLEINGEGSVTLGGALTLGSGIKLGTHLDAAIDKLTEGDSLTLFTGVTNLTYSGQAVALMSTEVAPVDAATVFAGLDTGVYEIAFAQNSVSINMLSIPEPTTATLSLLALAGLAARRRRRK